MRIRPELSHYDVCLPEAVARRRDPPVAKVHAFAQNSARKIHMVAVGQLTGGVAHDFNNFIHVVMINLELMEARYGDRVNELASISRAVERGAQLTQRLLAFSRRQSLSPQKARTFEPFLPPRISARAWASGSR